MVRRELYGDIIRSKRARNPLERRLLRETGRRICVIEVQGPLFFGSAERLIRRIGDIEPAPSHVVLDLRRLEGCQYSAPDERRIVDALEAGRYIAPFVVPEIRMRGAGRDDEIIEANRAVVQRDDPARDVDA